ncbi:MAG TPA: hypothetical protein PK906_08570 [Spirochaetota bacterium]|nr:hypothetical protein [Spirochaetota bacterium]
MKKLIPDSFIRVIILMTAFIIVLHTGSGAESVFMKNGAITEGRITESNDKEITIALNTGEVRTVGRKDITRILMHSRFREKIYLTRTDGITLEGYIVNENNFSYTLRKVLDSPDEIIIPRERVQTISIKRPSERILPPSVYSSVFLKDGLIIDCRIVIESAKSIEVQPAEGDRKVLMKNNIMRIQYNNIYRDRKIFRKSDGTKIEGYIMAEDQESYLYRTVLNSPVEERIYKSELKSISRK